MLGMLDWKRVSWGRHGATVDLDKEKHIAVVYTRAGNTYTRDVNLTMYPL